MSNSVNELILLPTSSEPAAPVKRATTGKLCFGLLLLFVVSLYALPAQLFPALAALHPAQVIAVSALLLLVIEKMTLHQSFVLVWPEGYLLLAFIGAAVLSTFSAFWPLRAYEAAIDLMRILVAYLLIVNTVLTEKRLRAFLFTMIIGGLFPAVGTLNGYLRGDLIEGRAHWIGIFGNPNELAYILVMVVPLAVVLASRAIRAHYSLRILLWVAVALYVTAIYLTQSRGSLLGLVGVMALLAIRQRGVILKLAMGALLVGGLVFTLTSWTRSDSAGEQDYTIQQRIATIKAGAAMFAAHPIVGVGIDCAIVAFPLYAPDDFKSRGALVIHNTIIQALSETGVLGFVPFMLLIACGLYHARKVSLSEGLTPAGRRMAVGLEVSLWGAMICGLSGGFLLSWFPYLVLGLIASTRQIALAESHES
jgi:putative inorganic carbon (HCO3(-)) transporter